MKIQSIKFRKDGFMTQPFACGGKGYLSVVHWMKKGFSYVQWKLEEMVTDGDVIAVR